MQYADVRMIQVRDGLSFTLEALFEDGIIGHFFWQDFDCDSAVQPCVTGAVHLTHPTRTQLRLDFIGPQLCSRSQTHTWAHYKPE
jgi:hypothetical protein